ncbi:MAG: DUF4270 domain-containing protein [Winogradskyella sp.]|uniref:DUF4270 domain-containing protein n=1 Tax=Winogradskyella sp. TaxID=1883156 RepID=UPI00385D6A04
MKKNKFTLQISSICFIVLSLIACDTDFATLESDVITNDVATNFDIIREAYDINTFTRNFGPVQTNEAGLTTLGIYDDVYGRTTSSFVTQLSLSSFDPEFGDNVIVDSVVVTLPFFSVATGVDDDENTLYEIDSILPKRDINPSIRLRIFENNFFIRDFDPSASFDESQAYFSNKTASPGEMLDNALEGEELVFIPDFQTSYSITSTNNIIDINNKGYVLEADDTEDDDDTEPQIIARQSPGIRVKLDPTFWKNKIIDMEGDPVLSNQNNFSDYFRGLYFSAEAVGVDGSFIVLNIGAQSSANVTIYYTRTVPAEVAGDPDVPENDTYVLNFSPNKINFFDNTFPQTIDDRIAATGDTRLYLKGGEGAIAGIQLFNGDDIDNAPEMNSFEAFKNEFVETDEEGNFVRSKRLVNEANLVFYVDSDELNPDNEPNRLYLFEIENNSYLVDYIVDQPNTSLPSLSKLNHLGPLQREETSGKGIKYKMRITEHINDLLLRDSTNVELGLAVSLNVNLEEPALSGLSQRRVQNSDDLTIPVSSTLTPRGTILHSSTSEDDTKRVKLEIYYTEPN